jgi:hypothetical protein
MTKRHTECTTQIELQGIQVNGCPINITTALRNCTSKSKLTGNLVDLMSHLSALISETPKQCTRDSALILSSPTHCWEYGSLVSGHCHSWPCSTQHEYQCENQLDSRAYKLNYPYTNTRLSIYFMEFDSIYGGFLLPPSPASTVSLINLQNKQRRRLQSEDALVIVLQHWFHMQGFLTDVLMFRCPQSPHHCWSMSGCSESLSTKSNTL